MFFACAVFLGACGAPVSKTTARGLPPVTLVASANEEVTVDVLELICQSCAEHIIAGCRQIEGVASVEASEMPTSDPAHTNGRSRGAMKCIRTTSPRPRSRCSP